MALDLVVSGATGRMGRALGRLVREAGDLRALGGIAPRVPGKDRELGDYPEIVDVHDAGAILGRCDAIVDFSAPDQLRALLDLHGDALPGRAIVVGTTGLDEATRERLDSVARNAAVLVAANFSVGVNLLIALVERAARTLHADHYDVEIVEAHHRGKADAPSGTALALASAVARARDGALDDLRRDGRSGRSGDRPAGEIGLHALRGGGVAGEHIVHFLGDREQIALSHRAEGRDLFAAGALLAARWLATRGPGRYEMRDVLGL